MGLKTSAHYDTDPKRQNGRSVRLTPRNGQAVLDWIGYEDAELEYVLRNGEQTPKIRVRTKKGIRVALPDDVILKFGNRRNGKQPFFEVVKAS